MDLKDEKIKKVVLKDDKVKKIVFALSISAVVIILLFLLIKFIGKENSETTSPNGKNISIAPSTSFNAFADGTKGYRVIISEPSLTSIQNYKAKLVNDINIAGSRLRRILKGVDLNRMPVKEFINALLGTKIPYVFAEKQKYHPQEDWSVEDARILGDVNIVTPVQIFDNGAWTGPTVHEKPFLGYLMFTPGALLTQDCNVDRPRVFRFGAFSEEEYYELNVQRLLPLLRFANDECAARKTKGIITVPGIGCGCFAGNLQSTTINNYFNNSLKRILKNFSAQLPNISLVYFAEHADDQKNNDTFKFDHIKYRRVSSGLTRAYKPLLETPKAYESLLNGGEDFSNHLLFAFVAWDHVSFPGNDFYRMSRWTDDGVKAAATSSMSSILNEAPGKYDPQLHKFIPLTKGKTWESVAIESNIRLTCTDRLFVLMSIKGKDKDDKIYLEKQ